MVVVCSLSLGQRVRSSSSSSRGDHPRTTTLTLDCGLGRSVYCKSICIEKSENTNTNVLDRAGFGTFGIGHQLVAAGIEQSGAETNRRGSCIRLLLSTSI
jgi:hypothetical protein